MIITPIVFLVPYFVVSRELSSPFFILKSKHITPLFEILQEHPNILRKIIHSPYYAPKVLPILALTHL